MRVAIHQPNLLPRLKVLQKLAAADVWVVLDSVQYNEREWQNRTRIVPEESKSTPFWLSIPIHRPHGQRTLIHDVEIVDPLRSVRLIQHTLVHSFRRSPYWADTQVILDAISCSDAVSSLTSLCVASTCAFLQMAHRRPITLYASSIPVVGKASFLMAELCRHLKATEYLADSGAHNYLRESDFGNIAVLWQDWKEPTEQSPGISSWRDISALNYLSRAGQIAFTHHLAEGSFLPMKLTTDSAMQLL